MKYRMVVEWYAPGKTYIVSVPELVGRVSEPIAEGKTRNKAIFNAEDMLENLVELAEEEGDPLPQPQVVTEWKE